jgi:hypothetical protein
MKALGYITATILVSVYSTLLNGWGLTKLWAWFIVTTFGLKPLPIAAAIGVSLVASYLTHQLITSKEASEKSYGQVITEGFIWTTFKVVFALVGGFIVKAWM